MAKIFIFSLVFIVILSSAWAAPVLEKKKTDDKRRNEEQAEEIDTNLQNLEYHRYLQEVISVLEGDPEVRKRLENISQDDIKSGKAAETLDFAGDHVRTKLHEAKRREIDRLRRGIEKHVQEGRQNEIKIPEHLDHSKYEFEKDDLKKLIQKTHADLEAIDKVQHEDFKKHELKKEVQYREKVANAKTQEEWEKTVQQHERERKAQKEHAPVHHPGSKAQLEEVWEESDKMTKDSFDMKTFFNQHDIDSNGYLDPAEVEALFQRELDKVYNSKEEGYDPAEREEEEARMREHVVKEMDKDQDGLISYEEFMGEQDDPDFEKDEGWDTLEDKDPVFSEDELKTYEEEYDVKHGRQATYIPPIDSAHPPSFQRPGIQSEDHPGASMPNEAQQHGAAPGGH